MYKGGRQKLISLLLTSGTNGAKQIDLLFALRHYMRTQEMQEILEELRAQGKVQKFVIEDRAYRPTTMWRATTELEKE